MVEQRSPRISVLEERHVIVTLLYLREHEGCRKTDIYRDVSRNPRMPEKLDALEGSGMIVQEPLDDRNAVRIRLTADGREVADALAGIECVLGRVQ